MINNIKESMFNIVAKMASLNKPTADNVIEKLNKVTSDKIGDPDYILKPKELL